MSDFTLMRNLSCYDQVELKNNDFSFTYSEGNCWFVSVFNVLQSIAGAETGSEYQKAVNELKTDSSKPDMPKYEERETYSPKTDEPDVYGKYYDAEGNNISGKVTRSDGESQYKYALKDNRSTFSFPKLYNKIRRYVTSKYKSVYNGQSAREIASIINFIGNEYGYTFNAEGKTFPSANDRKCINNNLPFIFCTSSWSNGDYGTHALAGVGYKIYTKETPFWFFVIKQYKYFYAVMDGWNGKTRFLNLSNYFGVGGGMVVFNKNWLGCFESL